LDPAQRLTGEAPLPDTLYGHGCAVAALAYLGEYVLASGGGNGDIRFWDLHTMKELEKGRRKEAHQAPVTGLSFVASRRQLASTAEVRDAMSSACSMESQHCVYPDVSPEDT
jgi:WD40 repeat protein